MKDNKETPEKAVKTAEEKALKYANVIIPDYDDYHEWKKIKEAYLAGIECHRKMIEDATKEIIKCMD